MKKEQQTAQGLFPKVPAGMTFKVINYVVGKSMKPALKGMTLNNFGCVSYEGQSGGYHHFKSENCNLIVCTLVWIEPHKGRSSTFYHENFSV